MKASPFPNATFRDVYVTDEVKRGQHPFSFLLEMCDNISVNIYRFFEHNKDCNSKVTKTSVSLPKSRFIDYLAQ